MILGVTGKPIAHSLSPTLHQAAMRELGITGASLRLVADSSAEALSLARRLGLTGLNVTAPFKRAMFSELAGVATVEAKQTEAINAITFRPVLKADNTDVGGVRACIPPSTRGALKCGLVLGAGGAARAAVCALQQCGLDVLIANRTIEHAQSLTTQLGGRAIGFSAATLAGVMGDVQLIVSTIPNEALETIIPILQPGQILVNAIYADAARIEQALSLRGVVVVDGREWLLQQGRLALAEFLQQEVNADVLRQALQQPATSRHSIALVGMMGSGKSVVGSELAAVTGLPFVDADVELEKRAAASIATIFAQQGEGVFRRLEQEVIADLCGRGAMILACGGGVVLSRDNIARLREHATIVWLWADPEVLSKRVDGDLTRPLLRRSSSDSVASAATGSATNPVISRLDQILTSRLELYAAAADLVIDTTVRSPSDVAARILYEVH